MFFYHTLYFAWALSASLSQSIGEGSQLLDDWQLEDARIKAERALSLAPKDAAAQLLAAEVLHQEGRHLDAVSLWRSSLEQHSPRAKLLGPVLRASAGYARFFLEVQTPHFKIHYMNKDVIVAAYAGDVLEAAYTRIGADLGFLPAERGEKIVVEIYPDARGLAGATGLTVKEIETSGTIAVCKFHRLMVTSPLATSDGYAWADTLAHEFIHLIISKRSHNNIPVWFHEGVAKYYESRWKGPAGQALTPYGEQLLARANRKQTFVTFKQMHPSMAKLSSQEQAALAFAEVFTVVEYINARHGSKAIARILERVGEGRELESAFKEVLGTDLIGLETAWKASLKKRHFRDGTRARPEIIALADGQNQAQSERPLEDMEDKQVHDWARLGELLQIRHRSKAAIVEYEKATAQSGVRYQSLVNRLARAYIDTGDIDRAQSLLTRSLTEHPEDSDARLLAGRIALKGGDDDAALKHYEAVRLQNPFNPEMHAELAKLYARKNDSARAKQETQFLELATAPRPTEDTREPPVAPTVALPELGQLRLVTRPWVEVVLDNGQPLDTPLWDVALKPGAHDINIAGRRHTVRVEAGKTTLYNPDDTP